MTLIPIFSLYTTWYQICRSAAPSCMWPCARPPGLFKNLGEGKQKIRCISSFSLSLPLLLPPSPLSHTSIFSLSLSLSPLPAKTVNCCLHLLFCYLFLLWVDDIPCVIYYPLLIRRNNFLHTDVSLWPTRAYLGSYARTSGCCSTAWPYCPST